MTYDLKTALDRIDKKWRAKQAACLLPGDQRGRQRQCDDECCVCKDDDHYTMTCGNHDYVAGCIEAYCDDHLPFTHEKCGRTFCQNHGLYKGEVCIKHDPAEGLPVCLACGEFFDQITPTAAQVAHLNRLRLSWGMLPLDAEVEGGDESLVMELCGEAAKGAARGFGHTTGELAALAVFKVAVMIAALQGLL